MGSMGLTLMLIFNTPLYQQYWLKLIDLQPGECLGMHVLTTSALDRGGAWLIVGWQLAQKWLILKVEQNVVYQNVRLCL